MESKIVDDYISGDCAISADEIINDILKAKKAIESSQPKQTKCVFSQREYNLFKEHYPDYVRKLEKQDLIVVIPEYMKQAVIAGETTALSIEYKEPKQYLPDIPCKTKRKATKKKYRYKKRKKR